MTLIHVPRPQQSAMNPDRPVSSLLLAQIQHLREAEKNLPQRYHTEKYINAIKTEREAAEYIREVTEAIHQAHEDAAKERVKAAAKRKRGLTIAAAAERRPRKPARAVKRSGMAARKRSKKRAGS